MVPVSTAISGWAVGRLLPVVVPVGQAASPVDGGWAQAAVLLLSVGQVASTADGGWAVVQAAVLLLSVETEPPVWTAAVLSV